MHLQFFTLSKINKTYLEVHANRRPVPLLLFGSSRQDVDFCRDLTLLHSTHPLDPIRKHNY